MAVDFFDLVWRLLTFIWLEDEAKINDLPMTFRRRIYHAVMAMWSNRQYRRPLEFFLVPSLKSMMLFQI